MKTDDLILHLAADPRPGPSVEQDAWRRVLPALGAVLVLVILGWGLRPDLLGSFEHPVTILKPLLPTLVAVASVAGALRLAQPNGSAQAPAVALALLAAIALVLAAMAFVQVPVGDWMEALRGRTMVACLLSIPALAILPTLVLLVVLRRGATVRPAWSGLLAGLGGGGGALCAPL